VTAPPTAPTAATRTAAGVPGARATRAAPADDRRTWVEQVMGLPVSVTVRGPGARGEHPDRLVRALFADLRRTDAVFSTYRPTSEISLIRRGVLSRQLVSPDVREVLDLCDRARCLTGGFFDAELPDPGGRRLPDADLLSHPGGRRLPDADLPDPGGRRLLDPSGLVKGWAVERAALRLDGLHRLDWLVNAGGDVLGRATHGPAWQIAIEDPRDRDRLLVVLPLSAGAVATSGTAARGRHLIDPRTGRPAPDLLSASVVGPSLTWADVLATAAFVEGPAALSRIGDLDGYEALLAHPDGRLAATPGMRTRLCS